MTKLGFKINLLFTKKNLHTLPQILIMITIGRHGKILIIQIIIETNKSKKSFSINLIFYQFKFNFNKLILQIAIELKK